MKIRLACGLLLGSLILAGCASKPQTVSTWERSVDRPLEYKNVLVLVFDSNMAERVKLEDEIADDLSDHFANATPSADIGLNLRTERWNTFASWVKNNNKQAVITVSPYRIDSLQPVDDFIVTETDTLGNVVTREWSDWNSLVEYGVEVVVWDTSTWTPMWQARSAEITHIDRIAEVSEFVEYHAETHGWWASR